MATESDNVNSGALGTLVAVGTFAMLGISLIVTALVRAEMAEELVKKEVAADRPYRDLVAEQTAQLTAPAAYKDRGRGLVSLPIDRAMELVVSSLVKDPNSATPPPPIGGSGGSSGSAGAASEAAGSGGMGGTGGRATTEGEGEKPAGEEPKPGQQLNKEGDQKEGEEKKEGEKPAPTKPLAPKPAPAPGAPETPTAPAPVAPTPAPAAPSPAPPNGQ